MPETPQLADLRKRWRAQRADTILALAALLRSLDREAELESEGSSRLGVRPFELAGDPLVPPEVRRDIEWFALRPQADRVGLKVPAVFDPHDRRPGWWCDEAGIKAQLNGGTKR